MGTWTLPPPSRMSEVARVETCNMLSSTSSDLKRITNSIEDESFTEVMPLSLMKLV